MARGVTADRGSAAVATAASQQQQQRQRRQAEPRRQQPRRRRRRGSGDASAAAAESGFAPASASRPRRRLANGDDEGDEDEDNGNTADAQKQAINMPPSNAKSTTTARKPPPALASAIAGGAAGALISACVQPLDVLRTRLQAEAALGAAPRSAVSVLRGIVASEGVRGLWRGTGPTVVRLSAGAALNFVALERLKAAALSRAAAVEEEEERRRLREEEQGGGQGGAGEGGGKQQQHHRHHHPHLGVWQAAAVGGLARALSAAVMSPVTLVKTRMEYGGAAAASSAAVPRYRGTFHALATIAREEGGLRGLFRGAGPTVLTNAPFSALYYLFYTRLQASLGPGPGPPPAAAGAGGGGSHGGSGGGGGGGGGSATNSSSSTALVPAFAVNFVSGVIAATAATLATQPTDVLRTRMQLGLGAGGAATSAAAALGQVLRAQGPAALLTGAGPRAAKRVLQTALVWTLYEELVPRLSAAGAQARELLTPALVGSVAGAGGEEDDDGDESSSDEGGGGR